MSAEVNPLDGRVAARRAAARRVGRLMEGIATAAALLAVGVLGDRDHLGRPQGAAGDLSVDFFTKNPAPFGQTGGGIENSIIGSLSS